ncbi:hypothetical protein CHUAL_009561 [Chamberlinius hualienensis]
MKNVRADLDGLRGEAQQIGISMGARMNQVEQDNASQKLEMAEISNSMKNIYGDMALMRKSINDSIDYSYKFNKDLKKEVGEFLKKEFDFILADEKIAALHFLPFKDMYVH